MRSSLALTAVLLTLLAAMLTFYFEFTADDAYIYMRYGANLSELVFNPGEWVSTMTSPAMALVYAGLHARTGEPRLAYKLLSVGLLLFTGGMVARSARGDPLLRVAVLTIALISPCVVVWTVGGMATPMLMALVTALTALTIRRTDTGRTECIAICGLCGLCFLVRYDSALYAAPVAIYALRSQPWRVRASAILGGAAVPVVWIAVALRWYGDVLPTSFYVKTPSASPADLAGNAFYMAQYLVFTGIVPVAVFLFAGRTTTHGFATVARRFWGPYVGIGFMLAYGLTSATTHMMFGFRYFVPYMPSVAILIATAWLGGEPVSRHERTSSRWFAIVIAALIASQGLQGIYTYTRSVNGIALNGELRRTGVRELQVANARSEDLARRIRAHWEGLGKPERSRPSIATFAEGIIPYRYSEAWVFGGLVSFRRDCPWKGPYPAHYSVLVIPSERARGPGRWRDRNRDIVISTEAFVLEGRSVVMGARFDPDPEPARLPPRVRGPCVDPRASSS